MGRVPFASHFYFVIELKVGPDENSGKGEFSQCPITRLRKSKETLYRETSLSESINRVSRGPLARKSSIFVKEKKTITLLCQK